MSNSAVNPTLTKAFIQPYGSGNDILMLPEETDVSAPSGGAVSFESDFAGRRYVGSRQTSNPERWTFDILTRRTTISKLRKLAKQPQCLNNIIILNGCPTQDFTQFSFGELYVDAGFAGLSASDSISKKTDQADPKLMDTLSISAAIRIEFHPLAHVNASGTVFADGSVNHIINLANPRCAGYCGDASDGSTEYIAVGDGASPATIPRIAYTADSGNTWTLQTIAAVANGAAESVTVAGNRVIVACSGTNGGVYSAPLSAVKTGTAVFAAVTGIATGAAYNAVLAVGSVVVACGASGALYISRDGGFSFTAITSGVATALNALASDDENVIWVGGASGVVLRLRNTTTIGPVTVTGLSTSGVTSLAVPTNRTNEVYVGTVAGKIFRSRNAADPTPTWEELTFDKPSGGGIIEYMAFSDDMGAVFWVVQTNGSTQSRVLIDRSGGRMATNAVEIGSFTSPTNVIINAIAPANIDYALTVGEAVSSNGFIGKIFG